VFWMELRECFLREAFSMPSPSSLWSESYGSLLLRRTSLDMKVSELPSGALGIELRYVMDGTMDRKKAAAQLERKRSSAASKAKRFESLVSVVDSRVETGAVLVGLEWEPPAILGPSDFTRLVGAVTDICSALES